jgi:HlyD family secretion protein
LKKFLLTAVVAIAVVLGIWFFQRKSDAPKVVFAKAARETISNTLSTNGKVEPVEYMEVRVEAPGLVKRLLVHAGDAVKSGQLLAELSSPGRGEDVAAAEARVAGLQAELETLKAGGRGSDRAELDGNSNRLKGQLAAAQANQAQLERLVEFKAATPYEVIQAKQVVADLQVQIQALEQRSKSLVSKGDVAGAEARVREAEANVRLLRSHSAQNLILAPMAGTVYSLPARAGAYLNVGDPVASIGRLEPVRVRVYVDEPELGRVTAGESVRITWDALPGKEWTGKVEKRPTEVVALGSRQVGEVLCTIENPGRELVPGTNVNAFILTQVVAGALTIPKSAVRRENGTGVYVLQQDGTVRWQAVKTGVSDALRVEVLSGVNEGDQVAQRSEAVLRDGMAVSAVQ